MKICFSPLNKKLSQIPCKPFFCDKRAGKQVSGYWFQVPGCEEISENKVGNFLISPIKLETSNRVFNAKNHLHP
jgi:hypothetical protein